MRLTAWLALPAIATAVACAQPAAAAVVTYTYTGVIDFGSDGIGLFGGGALNGKAFTAVFTRDDGLAEDLFVGDTSSYVRGAEAVIASLTIGGVSLDVGGKGGEQSQFDEPGFEGFFHQAAGSFGSFSLGAGTIGTFAPLAGAPNYLGPDYHTLPSLSVAGTPGLAWFGRFDFGAEDPSDPDRGLFTNGTFRPTGLTVAGGPVAEVPEPSTWALMILGFGAAGHALRRQRRPLLAA